MNESLSVQVLIPLLIAIGIAVILYSRRGMWRFPAASPGLIPSFLLILWVAGLSFGQVTRSLAGATWVSAAVLLSCSAILLVNRPSVQQPQPAQQIGWSILDWVAMVFIAFSFLRFDGNDPYCHYSVTATIIRDNVPPSSLNDPNFPLIYHAAFNLAAAVFVKGFGLSIETGLDIVSLLCVAAIITTLQFLSRLLFQKPWAQQFSRLFFLFGLGPTYWNPFREPGFTRLHGGTVQAFAEIIFRRPYGLNFVIFLFLLSTFVYLSIRKNPESNDKPLNLYLYLLPVAFLLPLASEELTAYSTGIIVLFCLLRRLDYKLGIFWIVALAAALPLSGVFRAHLAPIVPTPFPKLTFAWPLLLPRWPEAGSLNYSSPLFSGATIEVLLFEWGPVFFLGLLACIVGRDRTKRTLAVLILISFIPAFLFKVENWVQADLDRFLFYGTTLGFFLSAIIVERFELLEGRRHLFWTVPVLLVVVLITISASPQFLYRRTYDQAVSKTYGRILREGVEMRKSFQIVGPREQIKSDLATAQRLSLAGFVVVGPMSSNGIGVITKQNAGHFPDRADWILLRRKNVTGADGNEIAAYKNHILVRAK